MNTCRTRNVLTWASALLLCALPVAGQSVRGRILEAETGQAIAGARIVLVTAGGDNIAEAISNDQGVFQLVARNPGEHRLQVSHIAYRTATTDVVRIEQAEQVVVDVKLSRTAIALEPLTITARQADPRREATFEGFIARQLSTPPLGPARVITRSDHEMANARDPRDILTWLVPPRGRAASAATGCLIVYANGFVVSSADIATLWLETPSSHLEGVEYYRRVYDAPPSMREVPGYLIGCTDHTVLAVWSRRGYYADPVADATPTRRRLNVALELYRMTGPAAPGTGIGPEVTVHWPVLHGVAFGVHVRRTAHHLSAATTAATMNAIGPSTYVVPPGRRPLTLWVGGIEPRLMLGQVAGVWPVVAARLQIAQREFTLQASSSTRHDVGITSYGSGFGATVGFERVVKGRYAVHVAIGHDRLFFGAYEGVEPRWKETAATWGGTSLRVGFGYALER